jgi:hypothetical protein
MRKKKAKEKEKKNVSKPGDGVLGCIDMQSG